MKNVVNCIAQGMVKDTAISQASPTTVFDAHNIRLTAREDGTLLAITNEKSPTQLLTSTGEPVQIQGQVLGYCILKNYLVLFVTTNSYGTIYICQYDATSQRFSSVNRVSGDFNFKANCPIEAFGVVETENVYKVYWTDGLNPPRCINIKRYVSNNTSTESNDGLYRVSSTIFDFQKPLGQIPSIQINKQPGQTGVFPAGAVQYIFTYYSLNGTQSHPFFVSNLQYTTDLDGKGLEPNKQSKDSFFIGINLKDVDTSNWDYIRIYRIIRTELNTEVIAQYLPDVKINSSYVSVIDDGRYGTTVSPTDIYYLGGTSFKCKTFASKDARLFVGNLEINRFLIDNEEAVKELLISNTNQIQFEQADIVTASTIENTYIDNTSKKIKVYTYKYQLPKEGNGGAWGNLTIKTSQPCQFTINVYEQFDGNVRLKEENVLVYYGSPQYNSNDEHVIGIDIIVGKIPDANNTWRYRSVLGKGSPTGDVIGCTILQGVYNANFSQIITDVSGSLNFRWDQQSNKPYPNLINISAYTSVDEVPDNTVTYKSNIVIKEKEAGNYTFFKGGETYRFGIQFKNLYGEWSNVIYLDDVKNNKYPQQLSITKPNTNQSISKDYVGKAGRAKLKIINIDDVLSLMQTENTVSIRPVCVYPTANDRSVIAQGIALNTLKNNASENPIYYPDWFARADGESAIEWQNGQGLPGWLDSKSEVQCDMKDTERVSLASLFTIKRDLLCFYSPDIEFDPSIIGLLSSCKIREVGQTGSLSYDKDYNIELSNPGVNVPDIINTVPASHTSTRSLLNLSVQVTDAALQDIGVESLNFPLYVWNAKHPLFSSINSDGGITGLQSQTTLVKHLANTVTCKTSTYNNIDNQQELLVDVIKPVIAANNQIYDIDNILYYSNVDYVAFPQKDDTSYSGFKFGPVWFKQAIPNSGWNKAITEGPYSGTSDSVIQASWYYANTIEGVPIQYKTVDHAVFKLQNALSQFSQHTGYHLIEFYKDVQDTARFGGTSKEAILLNDWVPCGPEVTYEDIQSAKNTQNDIYLNWTQGDTYFQRYNCLKTYPYADDCVNSLVEVVSFLCETHINLNGRYDKQQEKPTNLYANPSNFNLINRIYSQTDNFFTYKTLDKNLYNTFRFPTQVSWSLPKSLGEKIDSWQTMTLGAVLDLDGSKGELTALRKHKDYLLFFQEHGYGTIDYNNKATITTEQGVPVQIANTNKVDGYTYLSGVVGCDCKNTILSTADSVYFVDNSIQSIYKFGGQQGLVSLSDKLGMSNWVQNYKITDTFWDKQKNDLYFKAKSLRSGVDDTMLNYNEGLDKFVSFFDYYKDYKFMSNINNIFIGCIGNVINHMFAGNEYYIPQITYRINGVNRDSYDSRKWQRTAGDKVFDYIEYRGDSYSEDGGRTTCPFTQIQAFNEYQDSGLVDINTINTKRKFRIWRTLVPRDSRNTQGKLHKDRIRNPWTFIKLVGNDIESVIYDVNVFYTE